ncbi:MAG: peptidylprolyl isomerase [Deltaproteobacteria bacterium]|nr:peptidylprolyl isomerase [Deltaproteobacteria bacterium]
MKFFLNNAFKTTLVFLCLSLAASPVMAAEKKAEDKKTEAAAKTETKKPVEKKAEAKKGDAGVVAQVNGQPIASKEFESALQSAKQQFASVGWQENDPAQLQKLQDLALDRLIDFELLYQASQKEKVSVDDAAISEKLAAFKKQFPSDDEFKKFLESNKLTDGEMKGQLRRKMAIEGLQKKLQDQFTAEAKVTDDDLQKFYDGNKDNIKQPERVRASHILVAVDEKADEAAKKAAMEKIQGIQKKLKDGGDFAALAKESSDCPSKEKGGDLDFFVKQQMVEPFANAAFSLPVGQTSDVVTTQFGYHLIKVTDKQPEKVLAFEEVKEKIRTYLTQQKIDGQFETYIKGLRDKADIKRMLPSQG